MATDRKNIVVVGLGPGGVQTATQLSKVLPATHRVVAIADTEFGFWPPASLRAAVIPGWEDKNTIPNAGLFSKSSPHILLNSTKVIKFNRHSIVVDTEHSQHGFGVEIPFDFAVIATGSSHPFPAGPPPGATTIAAVVAAAKQGQAEIANATSILVVGAGATGLEFAGEVKAHYPQKKVTVVSSSSILLEGGGFPIRVTTSLKDQMVKMGIQLEFVTRIDTRGFQTGPILPQTFKFASGNTIEADYIMLATGPKPNSKLVGAFDPSAVDASGHVKVLDTLQLASPAYSHIFAVGDVNDRPEVKIAGTIEAQVKVVVANIVALAKNGIAFKKHTPAKPIVFITLGPSGGQGYLFGCNIGPWLITMAKSKTLFLSAFKGYYPQA